MRTMKKTGYADVFWNRCLPRRYASSLRMLSFILQIVLGLMLVCAINQWVTDALLLVWPETGERLLGGTVVILVAMAVFGMLVYSFFHMFTHVKPHAAEEHMLALLQTNLTTGLNVIAPQPTKHPEEAISIANALPSAQSLGLRPAPAPAPQQQQQQQQPLRHRSAPVAVYPVGYSPRTIFGSFV